MVSLGSPITWLLGLMRLPGHAWKDLREDLQKLLQDTQNLLQ